MIDFLKFLLLPLLVFLGWWLGAAAPRVGHRLNRWVVAALLALWTLDALTGVFARSAPLHQTLTLTSLVAVWLAAPWAVGLFLQPAVSAGDSACALGALAALLLIPAALLSATTGYLGPTHAATSQHPYLFVILHLVVAPALAAACLSAWLFCARRASLDD